MAIRIGMANLVQRLREDCDAGTADFEIAGVVYWAEEQLQRQLDQQRSDIYREAVFPVESFINNESQYFDYYWRYGNVEEAESGSAAWKLEDANGSTIGTGDYAIDYDTRHITFPASTDGSTYYLTYRTFNVNLAAAEVWDKKAANVSSKFDVSTDNHSLKRSQLAAAYGLKAKEFRKKAGGRAKQMVRSDLSG